MMLLESSAVDYFLGGPPQRYVNREKSYGHPLAFALLHSLLNEVIFGFSHQWYAICNIARGLARNKKVNAQIQQHEGWSMTKRIYRFSLILNSSFRKDRTRTPYYKHF